MCSAHASELDEAFQEPSEATKPWCYWYWLNGDISEEGITKDLESMAKVGIKRAMIGNVSFTEGKVKMYSPEWYKATHHAYKEAARLSIELMSFNGPGWSQSGGPWIKPEQSMRRVEWAEYSAKGGSFSELIRPSNVPAGQDIAVLAFPKMDSVSIVGEVSPEQKDQISLAKSKWIWHPAENGAGNANAGTRSFSREIEIDQAGLISADLLLTADNSYILSVNGKEVAKDDDWMTAESHSIMPFLQPGTNTITIAVTNAVAGPAGLIAAVKLKNKDGTARFLVTDKEWLALADETHKTTVAALEMGDAGMSPWHLNANATVLYFTHTEPFTARALVVHGKTKGTLYALDDGGRKLVAQIDATGGNGKTDFMPDGVETFSFEEVTAGKFVLDLEASCQVELTSEPMVAQVIEKQMGRMHPTPSPTWESYIFPDTVEPGDPSIILKQEQIINLTDKLGADGRINCELPEGEWSILYFGMVTTGAKNKPAPPEATGLEVDKMSKKHVRHHFDSSLGELMKNMTAEERSAFKGITIDSYEVGAQNWTDGFAEEFEKRNGYDPLTLLPVMTGRLVDSAAKSDQFLWDLRRTVADMIAENYVGGLSEVAHEHGLKLWCENYGHWGFPGEFLIYGGYSDEIGGEFWTKGSLGTLECRAASSAGHIYGKRRIYAEAFTSSLDLGDHPYTFKARGEELFTEGINHFVLHVYAHQPTDGTPGKNPWFGTAFHRNTPWFNQSRDWVKYLQRCHTMLQQGNPVADVAVYIGDFAPQMTGPANPVPGGYDYDYMGSDAILRKLNVVDSKWVIYDEEDPKRISASYSLLAIPELKYVRPKVLERLEELKKMGGKTIHSVPVTADSLSKAGIAPMISNLSFPVRSKVRELEDGKIFFLCNFGNTGTFEATLRVTGKVPELFNPVTGEIRKLARYEIGKESTRISIDIKDRSDSYFLVFRDAPAQPSVVSISDSAGLVAPADLDLFYDQKNQLTGESAKAGTYTLMLSNGMQPVLEVQKNAEIFPIKGPWESVPQDEEGFTVMKKTSFELPTELKKNQRITLDLGEVQVMAKVQLNDQVFDTLWMPPFTLDVTDAVKRGQNSLSILVTSTSQGKPTLGESITLKTTTRETIR